jgi:HTH-type transcriptional regulator, competence development regulator
MGFRDNLRRLRAARVLSQAELADMSGVSRTAIARAETGQGIPHPRTIRRLAEALGVEPSELIGPDELLQAGKEAA